ncbi:MAG: DUF2284 domain-containing protein [Bacillota bacterium]
MKIEYHYKYIEVIQLDSYYNPTVITSYCAGCEKYGRYWSCPPHFFDTQAFVNNYNKALIVGMQVFMDADGKDFEEVFHEERRKLGQHMEELASKHEGSKIIIAGHCYQCDICSRVKNQPCIKPDKLRYSLESLGYEVSSISNGILALPILWPDKGKMPEYLVSVGAVLYNE